MWNNYEEQFLINNYSNKGTNYCASMLNRSKDSILSKAKRMNLSSKRGVGRPALTHEQYEMLLFDKEIDYWPIETYSNMRTKIAHTCLQGHVWDVLPADILNGNNCPLCSNSSFKLNNPAILYYVRLHKDGQTYYKVGVTNSTVEVRFKGEKHLKIDIIWIKQYDTGLEARNIEIDLLSQFNDYRVSDPEFIKTGFTELFTKDILGYA